MPTKSGETRLGVIANRTTSSGRQAMGSGGRANRNRSEVDPSDCGWPQTLPAERFTLIDVHADLHALAYDMPEARGRGRRVVCQYLKLSVALKAQTRKRRAFAHLSTYPAFFF